MDNAQSAGAAQVSGVLEFAASHCPEHDLITARSHLIDRFVPDCEVIRLPAKQVGGGQLSFERRRGDFAPPDSGKRKLVPFRKTAGSQRVEGTVLFDARLRNPQNWAHFLNNHLPICFALMAETGLSPTEITLLLPEKTPGYIQRAAEFFGFATLCTGDTVAGEGIAFTSEPWTGIRAVRVDWAGLPVVDEILKQRGVRGGAADDLPSRVFLSRRDTRNLENEAEVEAFLTKRGYQTVYPEDLSVADQLRLFEGAESLVAIHGAGLAPLLYLSTSAPLKHLIELFPCGHMTDVYRVMAYQLGRNWIGVRGKIKPEHVVPAYDLGQPFLKYSLQSFEVDLASLERAFEMI